MGFPTVQSDGGILCVIYSSSGGGKRPIHGAYYVNEETGWVPLSWSADGLYLSADRRSSLDITVAMLQRSLEKEQSGQTPE